MYSTRTRIPLCLAACIAGLGVALGAGAAEQAPAGATPASDPEPPALRLPGAVRPLAYKVDLRIDPSRDDFEGTVSMEIQIRQATSVIWLHAQELTLGEIHLRAGGAEVPVRAVSRGSFLGLVAEGTLSPGFAGLSISYRGLLQKTDTRGLFKQQEGEDWYVFSQFEPTSARRAFPCFDEPGFKVPWELSVETPAGLVAASNFPVAAQTRLPGDLQRVRFARSRPLPSYLVALVVGPFDVVPLGRAGAKDTALRILTPRGRAEEAHYAASITPALLERLEAYFDIPYPFDKLDEVAVPQTVSFGAMENPGLITYSMTGLLSKEQDLSINQRRSLANTTAHELAHQWFGNLVTLKWWDDVWLNEAFASWLASKIVEDWKPEWEVGVSRVQSRSRAMGADSLASARRIREPIGTEGDIENAFDSITYGKGAAVLAMFESAVGNAKFRAGIHRYLTRHSYANADAADFLEAIAGEGDGGVAEAFETFLDQPGVPLVRVELQCPEGQPARLALTQKRFLPTGSTGAADGVWQVPVCVRYGRGEETARSCLLLATPADSLELEARVGCPEWVLGNAGATGYYRVAYEGGLLERLLADGAPMLSLGERVGVLGDASALVQAGELPMGDVLAHVPVFARDGSRHVLGSLVGIVGRLRDDLVPRELRPNYGRFVRSLFQARAEDLGFTPRPDEDEDTRLLRPSLVGLVADEGESKVLRKEADRLARAWLRDRSAVAPELVGTVLAVAAIDGSRKLWDELKEAARSTSERRERRSLLRALGSFRDPKIAKGALALVLGDEFDVRESYAILWSALGDHATRDLAWAFFRTNYEALTSRLPRESLASLPFLASGFCDEEHRQEAETFFAERVAALPGAERNLRQALERMSLCIAGRKAQQASVAAFLERY